MKEFDTVAHRERMQPHADKLVAHFAKQGIKFQPQEGEFDNVIFTSPIKVVKISHHSFYRYSGIACITKPGEQNTSEYIEVTDAMFMDLFMKPIVETLLKSK